MIVLGSAGLSTEPAQVATHRLQAADEPAANSAEEVPGVAASLPRHLLYLHLHP